MSSKKKVTTPTASKDSLLSSLLQRQQTGKTQELPFVSVICPTWNRREFLPYLLYIYQYQDYPADKRELIIVDDSAQSNEDLIEMLVDKTQQNVRYLYSEKKLILGEKRNLLNELATGKYIICFDDDDYYPQDKISAQVGAMQTHNATFSGCDQIYIWYSHLDKIYRTRSFGKNHALNGTFGYHRNFLRTHRYDDAATLAEEVSFLNNFTAPVLQLPPEKAILCISHSANTYDKDFILGSTEPTDLTLEDFVQDNNLLSHYRRLSTLPTNTRVEWNTFSKIAVLYEAGNQQERDHALKTLRELGVSQEQLLPVEKVRHESADRAELETHCQILEQAKEAQWPNVLLLDARLSYVHKEGAVNNLNSLLRQLPNIDWQVLLLGANYHQIIPLKSLNGVARIGAAECGCAYAVQQPFIDTLLAVYREALAQNVSLTAGWPLLMRESCWLGCYPSYAFLQHLPSPDGKAMTDSTHLFFKKIQPNMAP
ncbi:glycosyltransferase family 2 protein [Scandinavium sp. NPDC088450]|uniref:glycosyltransferase family 2 protein n=1 Tax=Scandinavium sp. NPDC088450 TaxID=3364514 RepID=UPI00384F5057